MNRDVQGHMASVYTCVYVCVYIRAWETDGEFHSDRVGAEFAGNYFIRAYVAADYRCSSLKRDANVDLAITGPLSVRRRFRLGSIKLLSHGSDRSKDF